MSSVLLRGTASRCPGSLCWQLCRFKAQARNGKKASSLGKEEHLVEKQSVNVSTTAPPPRNLPALEFELHSAVIETRLFNTGANYCLLMQGALIDTAITQLCKAGEHKMRWKGYLCHCRCCRTALCSSKPLAVLDWAGSCPLAAHLHLHLSEERTLATKKGTISWGALGKEVPGQGR